MQTLDKKYKDKAFAQHRINGFRLIFPNGNSLSTIWGFGSYSENHTNIVDSEDLLKQFETFFGSDTVEIMPSCSDKLLRKLQKKYPENENGGVFGHLTFNQWLEIVNILSKEQ